jgi:hypothetical protein
MFLIKIGKSSIHGPFSIGCSEATQSSSGGMVQHAVFQLEGARFKASAYNEKNTYKCLDIIYYTYIVFIYIVREPIKVIYIHIHIYI